MGLPALIRRLYQNAVRSENLRYGTFPTSADGVAAVAVTLTADAAAWTWGAYAEIVAAAGITVETQISGLTLENFVGGIAQGEVEIAIGGAGAEAAVGRFPIAAGQHTLPKAIRVPAATRLSARYRTSTVTADTGDIKLGSITGF